MALAAENTTTGTRVVWINCPNFLQGTINQSVSGGNAQLLGSIVNWFDGEQTTAVISGKSLSAGQPDRAQQHDHRAGAAVYDCAAHRVCGGWGL